MSSRPLRSAPPDRFADLAPHDLTPAETDSLIRLALAALAERHRPGVALGSPEDTRAYLRLAVGERRNEVFGCVSSRRKDFSDGSGGVASPAGAPAPAAAPARRRSTPATGILLNCSSR